MLANILHGHSLTCSSKLKLDFRPSQAQCCTRARQKLSSQATASTATASEAFSMASSSSSSSIVRTSSGCGTCSACAIKYSHMYMHTYTNIYYCTQLKCAMIHVHTCTYVVAQLLHGSVKQSHQWHPIDIHILMSKAPEAELRSRSISSSSCRIISL